MHHVFYFHAKTEFCGYWAKGITGLTSLINTLFRHKHVVRDMQTHTNTHSATHRGFKAMVDIRYMADPLKL